MSRIQKTTFTIREGGLAFPARFELTAYRLGGDRSILLSYGNKAMLLIIALQATFSKKKPPDQMQVA